MSPFTKTISLYLSLSVSLLAGDFQAIKTPSAPELKITEANKEIHFKSIPTAAKYKSAVSYGWRQLQPSQIQAGNTLSFEVLGDGSDFYASAFLGADKFLLNAHEATFPLKSTQWQTVEIPLEHFTRNQKPWGVKKMDGAALKINSKATKFIGFGRGFQFNAYNHPSYSFKIRNIKFIKKAAAKDLPILSGLSQLKKKLRAGKDVNILLLGDSITHMGKEMSHTYHAFEELKKSYKSKITIKNMAIGGHSVRGAEIVLPRSLRAMPKPDLIVIFFGANDCKSLGANTGFSDQVFEKQLLSLIQRVNKATDGESEFLLINGVPRIEKKKYESTKLVEPLSPAYARISKNHDLVLCDSLSVYNSLSLTDKKSYFKDTIHQNQNGLKFLGSLIAETIQKTIE